MQHAIQILFVLTVMMPTFAHAATVLDVPFTTQAPQNQWRVQPFRDACEEASIIMIDAFYENKKITPQAARTQILDYVKYEMKHFGYHKDTNAHMTAQLINEHSNFFAFTVEDADVETVKTEIDAGRPVIFHAYAPALRNPHYKLPTNPYHAFVIIGYDDVTGEFIVHDPGTSHGKNYQYSFETLMHANHDWVAKKNRGQGPAIMTFTKK